MKTDVNGADQAEENGRSLQMLERYLDRHESRWLHRYPVFSMVYEGNLECEALREAFKALCDAYPILRSKVHFTNQGYLLSADFNGEPEFRSLAGLEIEFWRELRSKRPHYSNGISRLVLAEGEDRGQVGLQVNHAFFDGSALLAMVRELWCFYDEFVRGDKIHHVKQRGLPECRSKVANGIFDEIDVLTETDQVLQNYEVEQDDALNLDTTRDPFPIQARIRLGRDETTTLIRAARKLGESLHSVVCGAIMVALRRDVHPSESVLMGCRSTVDVRRRVSPPIDSTDAGMFAIFHWSVVPISCGSDPIVVGREIKNQLGTGISNRFSKPRVLRNNCGPVQIRQLERQFKAAIGNSGAIPEFQHSGDLSIVDVEIIAEGQIDRQIAFTEIANGETIPYFSFHTFREQLSIDGRFPVDLFDSDSASKVIESCTDSLKHLSEGSGWSRRP